VRRLTRALTDRHRLLTGLRHPRDWAALSPPAVDAALVGLRAAFGVVVADVDDDLEGRSDTGSNDLEERNGLGRATVRTATAVVVVARGDLLGVHRLCHHLRALTTHGVDPRRITVVANGARRRAPTPRSLRRDLTALLDRPLSDPGLITVPHLPSLEARRRDARPPAPRLLKALAGLDHLVERNAPDPPAARPSALQTDAAVAAR
jgi:hypothetical protein